MKQLKKIAAVLLTGALALTMLAGCGGSSSGTKRDEMALINIMLQVYNCEDVVLTEDPALTKQAQELADLAMQANEISADTSSAEDIAFVENIDEQFTAKCRELRKSNILFDESGAWTPEREWNVYSDEARAADVAYYIAGLEGRLGDEYKAWEERGFSAPVKVTGIGIAKVSDMNDFYWDGIWEKDEDGTYHLVSTRKFDGWIVLVACEPQ